MVWAVIDSGIDDGHVDLDGGKVLGWADFIAAGPTPSDDNGHGTHVASIIAGEGQGNPSLAGVAPGAALVGVKVLDSSGNGSIAGSIAGVNAGIQWVIDNKAAFGIEGLNINLRIVGCSDGTDSTSQLVNQAVAAGIVSVVAAGNEGPTTCILGSPSAAEDAITVGSMADPGHLGFYLDGFSSRGPTFDSRIKPDIVGAGHLINAARNNTTNLHTQKSGTSMATPFVSGVAALMLDGNAGQTPARVKATLEGTAIDWGPAGRDIDYGSGRLDAYEAVKSAVSGGGSGPAVPTAWAPTTCTL